MESNPIASVFLRRSGDEKNKMLLSDQDLVVIYKGKKYVFERSLFRGLEVGFKKFLFPLIAGGILLPLSFLALATNDFNPFFLILFLLAGFYLLYAGWSGSPVLTVLYDPKPYDFPLFHISDNLRSFIEFTNARLFGREGAEERRRYIFLEVDEGIWNKFKMSEYGFSGKSQVLTAKTWDQWHSGDRVRKAKVITLMIDLFRVKTSVFYEYDKKSHALMPRVEWPVNTEAVSEYNDAGNPN